MIEHDNVPVIFLIGEKPDYPDDLQLSKCEVIVEHDVAVARRRFATLLPRIVAICIDKEALTHPRYRRMQHSFPAYLKLNGFHPAGCTKQLSSSRVLLLPDAILSVLACLNDRRD